MPACVDAISLAECERLLGGESLNRLLCRFTCPLNPEVEDFLKSKAIQSSRLASSVTYLVIDCDSNLLLGYFTIVLKAYAVKGANLNSKNRRLVARFAEEDDAGNFNAAVYLIAQIGKNFSLPKAQMVAGSELLDLALRKLSEAKSIVGGKLVMVEREKDRPKLHDFYSANGFKSWTSRHCAKDNVTYDQMFTVLSDPPVAGKSKS